MPKVKITGLPKGKKARKLKKMYEDGGQVTPIYNPAVPEVSVYDLTKQAMGGMMYANGGLIYKLGGPIKAGEGYVQNEPSEGFAYGGAYATSDSPRPQVTSGLMNYLGYGKPRPYDMGGDITNNDPNKNEPFEYIRNQKMSPQEWVKFNESKGYKKVPYFSPTGEKVASYSPYPDYYNPSKYVTGEGIGFGGFRRIEDATKPTVNYANDPSYRPIVTYDYKAPVTERPQPRTPPLPRPKTLEEQGWRRLSDLEYQRNMDNPKQYAGLEYMTEGTGTPGVNAYYTRLKEPIPGMVFKKMGGKMPEPVLRARLNAHMSPEEVDNYIANYANGGQTGTGILGNMTYDLKPWKYVGGGQLGPYPYSSYKSDLSEFKEGGIHIKPENRGKFTAAAKKAGMGVQEYAKHVMANKENYSPTLVKRANFARNAAKWHHAYGGYQLPQYYPGGPTDPPVTRTPDPNQGFWDYMMSSKLRGPQEEPGFMEYAESQPSPYAQGPRDMTDYNTNDYSKMTDREKQIQLFMKSPMLRYNRPAPIKTSLDDPNFGKTKFSTMTADDVDIKVDPEIIKRGEERMKKDKQDKLKEDQKNRRKNNLYYASQYLQQAAPELSYLLNEGKNYDIAPEYTYTPEQMSARMPLIEYTSGMAQMRNKMREAYGNNPALYLASLQNLAAQSAKGRAGIVEGIDLQNIAARNAAQQANIGYKQMSDEATARNKQAALNQYYQTLESLGTTGATVGKDRRMDEMDKYKWGMLPYITPAMMKDPKWKAYFEEGYPK